MKILLMEDDPVLSDILLDFLQESYEVDYAYSSEKALELSLENRYQLFLFDINVPGKNGLELLEEIRSFQDSTPAIIITAYQDTKHLKEGFAVGADDYLRKPFDLEELEIRIENIKRRYNIDSDEIIQIDELRRFNPKKNQLIMEEETFTMTPKESEILHYFIAHPKRAVSFEELIQNIWEYESMPTESTIRSYIKTIRQLIGKEHLESVRGLGYRYE